MPLKYIVIFALSLCTLGIRQGLASEIDPVAVKVEGWNILSDRPGIADRALEASRDYGINHLQISHDLIMNLAEVRQPERAARVNHLVDLAHDAGIEEVCVWDHALYEANYYPERFRSAQGGLIDLDNPEFWSWLQDDYRAMLDLVPQIDGIVLTFIETGTHVEDQHSVTLLTEAEKLAALVDAIAEIAIEERGLQLYVRTFVYTRAELDSMLESIDRIKNPHVRVMTKEVPHDFFLTHPVSDFVERIKRPTLIEFDAAHEYSGQTVVASAFPEVQMQRWDFYKTLPQVIGYVARLDRFGETSVIGDLAEINLFALHMGSTRDHVDIDELYQTFVAQRYGPDPGRCIERALRASTEVIPSTFYTLGLCLSFHSRLDFNDAYAYQRHVSGKWMQNPKIKIEHGVNRTFHYWADIVNHLSEPRFKADDGRSILSRESPWVFEEDWLEPVEKMNETYLRYNVEEKDYGVRKAEEAYQLAEKAIAQRDIIDAPLRDFRDTLERTLLTARLYQGAAKVYFGYRVFARGESHRSDYVVEKLRQGLEQTRTAAFAILERPDDGPQGGQYEWKEDAFRALAYSNAVQFRPNDLYGPDFFPTFSFASLSPEKRAAILERADRD